MLKNRSQEKIRVPDISITLAMMISTIGLLCTFFLYYLIEPFLLPRGIIETSHVGKYSLAFLWPDWIIEFVKRYVHYYPMVFFGWLEWFINCGLIFVLAAIFFVFSPKFIEKKHKIVELPKRYDDLQQLTSNLCLKLGLKKYPKLCYIDSQDLNAFTYGRTGASSKVVLTEGLIRSLEKNELESVILHELSHIVNKDVGFMTWGTCFLRALKYYAIVFILKLTLSLFLTRGYGYVYTSNLSDIVEALGETAFIGLNLSIAFMLFFLVIVINSTSRNREFLADAVALQMSNSGLVSPLKKIYLFSFLGDFFRNSGPSHLCIRGIVQHKPRFISRFVASTHPPLTERIKAIETAKHVFGKGVSYHLKMSFFTGMSALFIFLSGVLLAQAIRQCTVPYYSYGPIREWYGQFFSPYVIVLLALSMLLVSFLNVSWVIRYPSLSQKEIKQKVGNILKILGRFVIIDFIILMGLGCALIFGYVVLWPIEFVIIYSFQLLEKIPGLEDLMFEYIHGELFPGFGIIPPFLLLFLLSNLWLVLLFYFNRLFQSVHFRSVSSNNPKRSRC